MGLAGISIWQLLIVAVIVLIIFGGKRVTGILTGLGDGVKNFKTAIKDDPELLEEFNKHKNKVINRAKDRVS